MLKEKSYSEMASAPLLIKMGKRIAKCRKQKGLSQEALAEQVEVSAQTISTAERGTKAIRPENLLKIGHALGVSADYLLTGCMVEKDVSILLEKMKEVTPREAQALADIIDQVIHLATRDQ